MKSNPPIRGHALLLEGSQSEFYHLKDNGRFGWEICYGCECGARPEPYAGVAATKRWHREHKAELRGES